MKLDESIIDTILCKIYDLKIPPTISDDQDFYRFMQDLDLVFKPGDASQSTLVENRTKNTNIEKL